MQPSLQAIPLVLNASPAAGAGSSLKTQPVDNAGDVVGADFIDSLEESIQELARGEIAPLLALDQAQLLATVEQYLAGAAGLSGGKGMPLVGVVAADDSAELTANLRELMERLRTLLLNGPSVAPSVAELSGTAVATAVVDSVAAQASFDQRRLLERFQSLPELRRSTEAVAFAPAQPTTLLDSPLNSASLTQGDELALQLGKMAELSAVAMPLKEGALLDAKGVGIDLSSSLTATTTRQPGLLTGSAEARPVSPTYIHVPLGNTQWQSELGNRVTWLARAGGNQSAEIRLNPANLGPIEVKIMMKDDQATITFNAQHGVVRDAIEASLPRLREMFLNSGMQLAQANVSDQPFQEPRQRQQSESREGDGPFQESNSQADESGEQASSVALSQRRTTELVESVDLYV